MAMRLLYDDALAPLTSAMGFLAADITRVVDGYMTWQTELAEGRRPGPNGEPAPPRRSFLPLRFLWRKPIPRLRPVAGPLSHALSQVLPLTVLGISRHLFVPTAGPWVAYFNNWVDGTDCSAVSYMAMRLDCRGIRAVAISEEREAQRQRGRRDAATILEIYEGHKTDWLNYARTIAVINDDPWIFEMSGTEQPFEEPENYTKKRIQDRFTPEMLDRYLRALGIRAFDDSFYLPEGSEAILIEEPMPRGRRVKTFTLEAALTRFDK
jgi:hypothetical protein